MTRFSLLYLQGKVGNEVAYEELRRLVDEEIRKVYPNLREQVESLSKTGDDT